MKHYARRDLRALGRYYTDHIQAMTTEGLDSKSDIAAELAHRDRQIADLTAACQEQQRIIAKQAETINHYEDLIGCIDSIKI